MDPAPLVRSRAFTHTHSHLRSWCGQVFISGAVNGHAVWPQDLEPVAWHRDAEMVRMKLGLYHSAGNVADGEVSVLTLPPARLGEGERVSQGLHTRWGNGGEEDVLMFVVP